MKLSVSPRMVVLLFLGSLSPLGAQNLAIPTASQEAFEATPGQAFTASTAFRGSREVPDQDKAVSKLPEAAPAYATQDVRTLAPRSNRVLKAEAVVPLNVLRKPSAFRRVAVSNGPQPYIVETDSLQKGLAMVSALYRESGKREKVTDRKRISLSVEQRIRQDVSRTLETVQTEIAANPSSACEIVKSAIQASDADVPMVVSIVETAVVASPENMRLISQCAIASAPESIAAVQSLLARLDPNTGDAESYSSKRSKSAKSAKSAKAGDVAYVAAVATPNPLDTLMRFPPIVPFPPPVIPPPVTQVNPIACLP